MNFLYLFTILLISSSLWDCQSCENPDAFDQAHQPSKTQSPKDKISSHRKQIFLPENSSATSQMTSTSPYKDFYVQLNLVDTQTVTPFILTPLIFGPEDPNALAHQSDFSTEIDFSIYFKPPMYSKLSYPGSDFASGFRSQYLSLRFFKKEKMLLFTLYVDEINLFFGDAFDKEQYFLKEFCKNVAPKTKKLSFYQEERTILKKLWENFIDRIEQIRLSVKKNDLSSANILLQQLPHPYKKYKRKYKNFRKTFDENKKM